MPPRSESIDVVNVSLPADSAILFAALVLVSGVLGAGFADRIRVPALLFFLVIGMIIGDDGLGLISLSDPRVAQIGGSIALLLILYEGGLTTRPSDLRRAGAPGLTLASVGVVITAILVGLGAMLVADVSLTTGMLLGAVVGSTDAAAVFTVLRRAPIPRRLSALLEVESGTNDPVAIMLTVGMIATAESMVLPVEWLGLIVVQLGGGLVVGVAVGWAGSWALSTTRLGAAGLYPVLALAVAGMAYGVAAAFGASGFLAVYIAGLFVGARVPRHRRSIRTFHDGLANTAEIGLFLMLGVLVFPSNLIIVALPAAAITVILVLVARPVTVLLCLPWFGFSVREMGLISWAGLRGAVPIVLATFPLVAGHPQGGFIFNVVFFVVLVSVALQGSTVSGLARRLGLQAAQVPWGPVAEAVPLDGVDAQLIEVDVTPQLAIAGKTIREVPLPEGSLLTAIMREGRTHIPTGSTRIEQGDLLLVATPPRETATQEMTAWARGEELPPSVDEPEGESSPARP